MKKYIGLLGLFALFSCSFAATTDDCGASIYKKLAPLSTYAPARDHCVINYPRIKRTYTRLTGHASTVISTTGTGKMATATSEAETPTTTVTIAVTTGETNSYTVTFVSTPTRTISLFTGTAPTITTTACPAELRKRDEDGENTSTANKKTSILPASPSRFSTVLVERADVHEQEAGEDTVELFSSFVALPGFVMSPACSCLLHYPTDEVVESPYPPLTLTTTAHVVWTWTMTRTPKPSIITSTTGIPALDWYTTTTITGSSTATVTTTITRSTSTLRVPRPSPATCEKTIQCDVLYYNNPCADSSDCYCLGVVGDKERGRCMDISNVYCDKGPKCETTKDCPCGHSCSTTSCCGFNVCVPWCSATGRWEDNPASLVRRNASIVARSLDSEAGLQPAFRWSF